MILKIQDLQTLETDDIIWTLFDKITNIKYCKLDYNPEVHTGFEFDLIEQETKDNVSNPGKDISIPKIVAIYCSGKENSFSFITERMAYILNDEGKTIERIN